MTAKTAQKLQIPVNIPVTCNSWPWCTFGLPDISLSLLSYYLLAGTRILEEKKEYSVELKRTWVPSILVFCANFNHFESLDLITEHMACRLQTQMVPRFVIVSNSIEKSDFQKDLSSIVISMYIWVFQFEVNHPQKE